MNAIPLMAAPRWAVAIGGLLGVLGIGGTAVGYAFDRREAAHAYLFAFMFWLTLALGGLFMLAIFHTTRARWPVVLRRPLEWMSMGTLAMVPLFAPIPAVAGDLFAWRSPPADASAAIRALLEHQRPYLNFTFFLIRAVIYFAIWCAVAILLRHFSRKQDESGALQWLCAQRVLSAGALPLMGLAFSFAALDWVMALDSSWSSTIFGFYVFTGGIVAALALLAWLPVISTGTGSFAVYVKPAHSQRLGTLLFACICLWVYCGFSQAMLIWIAGLPREATWYLARMHDGWRSISFAVVGGGFVLPFFLLLFRRVKQGRYALAAVSLLLLVFHALDTYWLVFPALHVAGPSFHWTAVTSFIGVGGIYLGLTVWLAGGDHLLPLKDPYLPHSLEVTVK